MIFAFRWMSLVNILLFLIILCATISIHELGHLLFAKRFKVYCYEYSIGFGKAIYKNKKHETHFCIRMIPLGGFVKMAGEEGVEEGEEVLDNNGNPIPKERIFGNIKKGPKILVLAAGGLFNMALAYLCFFIFLMGYGVPLQNKPIVGVSANSTLSTQISELYQEENLGKAPTKIYITGIEITIDDQAFLTKENPKTYSDIQQAISKSNDEVKEGQKRVVTLTFKESAKAKKEHTVSVESLAEATKKNQYMFSAIGVHLLYQKYNFFEAFPQTFKFMAEYFVEVCKAFGRLFTGHLENLSGLVGIYKTVDGVASSGQGILPIIYIAGAISFSLGFFNLMPIPALDGGRIVFVLIEAITRKKVSPKVEGWIHTVGFILLFGLMIVINIKDIIGLF